MSSQTIVFSKNRIIEEEDDEEIPIFHEEELPLGDLYFTLKDHINSNNLPLGDTLCLEEFTDYVNSRLS